MSSDSRTTKATLSCRALVQLGATARNARDALAALGVDNG